MMKKNIAFSRQRRGPGFRIRMIALGFLLGLSFAQVSASDTPSRQDDKKVVTGTVSDANTNEVLPGVSIQIKGTTTGVVTDIDGHFTLEASTSDILVFSSVGYLSEEVQVGDQTEITLRMAPDIIGLDEVVVVGYGVQKKKLVTYDYPNGRQNTFIEF